MINALQSIWNFDRNSVHDSERRCRPSWALLKCFVPISVDRVHGRRQNFFQGGQRRNFAYNFQAADNAR